MNSQVEDALNDRPAEYRFERLPIDPIEAGTNVRVTGPSLGGLRDLLMASLVGSSGEGRYSWRST